MARVEVAITLDEHTLRQLDRLVREGIFPNRSRAVEATIEEKVARLDRGRLARECAKLDPQFEKALAGLWDNEEDAIYDDWRTLYGVADG